MIRLVHVQSGCVLADRLEVSRTVLERMRGLLGRRDLAPGGGMMIERCSSIQTFFMRFPIDVIFLDKDLVVRKVIRNLRPWRCAMALGASHVVELPAGTIEQLPVAPGDALCIERKA